MFATVNPATGEKVREFPEIPPSELIGILAKMETDQLAWSKKAPEERVVPVRKLAGNLLAQRDSLARTITLEMGKPLQQAQAEIEKCAWVCEYYAEHAVELLKNSELEAGDGRAAYLRTEPLGVILNIMPWNFPFWQLFRAAIPAVSAGNGILLKHASNTPQCGLSIEALFQDAGFPLHLLRNVMVNEEDLRFAFVHAAVQGITLTGSTEAGRTVAASAGAQLKKTVLELGGSDPYLILEDADLDQAAEACVASRMINSGQSCIAAKRFIVVGDAKRHESFVGRIVERIQAYPMSDPVDPGARLGPLARPNLRDKLHEQVEDSRAAGAELRLGGEVPKRPGNWYPATVLDGIKPGMPAFDQELFGPVAAIARVPDEATAIEWANASNYGLGGALFTADIKRAHELAAQLAVGSVAINDFVKSDPRQPFGGIRESGYGRELGPQGIYEFSNRKTVVYPED
ncbi:succinate-semialdehyde dehydrogenase [Coraliomargarita sinensis]|uniref:Succinate-semialdehyde dehydrogenase n=1 Tax=Coraliomargarita sinensis TaxID=2174842 RepID=A0A317ZLF9_9BACT|nr:NAD-dependent succinate-semialdehyde dehydrogenase [Coraliomargarita sinensis]PXA05063.1 succinate-semialdehyde dehydrogenase [Coraliomargarita sinensis]